MAWTQDDLDKVDKAIKELVAGKRLVAVDLNGRVEQYGTVRLPELIDLRDKIRQEIAAAEVADNDGRRSRVFRTRHSKGL